MYDIELLGDYPGCYLPTITKHGTVDDTGLCEFLKFKIGARVMIVLNVNTSDYLVNGSLGVVLDVVYDDNGEVKCIIVKFDSEKAGSEQRKNYANIADKYVVSNSVQSF